jgi:uncharacterized circularly permuted ATP-grasp superfamily protein
MNGTYIERGVIQRVTAINLLLDDLYHGQKILKDGIIPADLILGNANWRPQMRGVKVPHKAYVNICGTDIIRDEKGVPRPRGQCAHPVRGQLRHREPAHDAALVPRPGRRDRPALGRGIRHPPGRRDARDRPGERRWRNGDPEIVLLSPGTYNSAYFEHVFLAREMGVPLVEGRDLVVENDRVYMRTTGGLARVDVIYRRINDDFLDPEAFRPDSALGVPGLMRAYFAGNVALANAIGTGVADDKAVYAYMPRIIRYYLSEDPVIENVETNICREGDALRYTLDHLAELVVKPVGEAGGYGITIGPRATRAELDDCRAKLIDDPANYISQPCIAVGVADLDRRRGRAAPCRSAAVRDHRREHLGAAGRLDASGAAPRLAGRQFLAGRRVERHVGA